MKKNIANNLLTILTVLIIIGIVIYCVIFSIHKDTKGTALVQSSIEENYSLELEGTDIARVEIDISFFNTDIIATDTDEIQVLSNRSDIKVRRTNDTLYIYDNPKLFGRLNWRRSNNYNMTVEIPKDFITNLKVENNFGNVTISTLTLTQLIIESNFGYVDLSDIKASEEINCYISFANMKFSDVFAPSLDFDVDFGNIRGTITGSEEDFRIVESSAFGSNNINNKSNGQYRIDATSSFGGIDLYFDDE